MSKTPFMPLWVSDFLGDTLDLDAAEIGAYMLLLMAQWNRDGNSLPSDQSKLKRVARCGRSWPKIWGNIQRYFDEDESGVYSKRLRLEAQNVALKREVNARNGSRGGRAKALKTNNVDLANATNSLKRNSSIPEPEPYIEEEAKASLSFGNDFSATSVDEISQAVSAYNDAAQESGWPKAQKISAARRNALKARLKECGGLEGWAIALGKAKASPHLCGQNDRGWVASFDFLTRQSSFSKLMEGNYDARPTSETNRATNGRGLARGATSTEIADRGSRWAASRHARG